MNEIIREIVMRDYAEALVAIPLAYGSVVLAVGVDLVTGIRKAKRNGEKIHSTGLKRSCGKIADYLLPMFVLTLVDLIAARWLGLPVLTMVYGAFCVGCEVKSVMERSWEKKRLRRMADVARKIPGADVAEVLGRLLDIYKEGKEAEDEKN